MAVRPARPRPRRVPSADVPLASVVGPCACPWRSTGWAEIARICPRIYVQDNGRRLIDGSAGEVMASIEIRLAYLRGEAT